MSEATLLRIAELERERRGRMARSAQAETGEPSSFLDKAKSAGRYGIDIVNEVNRGLLSFLPAMAREKLEGIGIGVETDFGKTGFGKGVNYTGMALPFMFGAPAAGTVGPQMLGRTGVFKTLIDDIANFAVNNPKMYFGTEVAGNIGAGAAGHVAEEGGAGPTTQLISEAVGGLTVGGLASVGPRSLRAMRESISANLMPMTEEGGMIRAARQTQARAGSPEAAQEAAQRLETIPEGVTPAQWIGDERLMAQEARLLQDNPELDNIVRQELQEARLIGQEELLDSFGRPRTRQEWEVSVLEKVTPKGTVITPGASDEMLDQAYRSFAPLYDEVKGFDIPSGGLTQRVSNAAYDPAIMAGDPERDQVKNWFNNMASQFDDVTEFDIIPSESLVSMRSNVRTERRAQSRRGNQERADLLGAVESQLTRVLETNIPAPIRRTLRAADSQYRKYKIVENAIFNAGDANLSPEMLSQSIRQGGLTSNSRYARGVDPTTQQMRRQAMGGRSTTEVLGDPQRASMFVRDLDAVERQAVHADFADVLFNRAKASGAEATESGIGLISGDKLLRDLTENQVVMENLGMSLDEIQRLRNMGESIQAMANKSPSAVTELFEDGPASIMQLIAALAGAKGGQRMAGGGLGSSMVMAQYMSNKARNTLARLTSNEAQNLMKQAVTDPQLYQALLTKPTARLPLIRERVQYLESWLLASAFNNSQGN